MPGITRTTYVPWYYVGFGTKTRKPEWGSRYRELFILGFYIWW